MYSMLAIMTVRAKTTRVHILYGLYRTLHALSELKAVMHAV